MVYDRVYTPPGKYCRRAPPLGFREKIRLRPGPRSESHATRFKKRGKFAPTQPPILANLGGPPRLIIKAARFPSGRGRAGQNEPGRAEAAAAASSIYGQGRRARASARGEEGGRGRRERARGEGGGSRGETKERDRGEPEKERERRVGRGYNMGYRGGPHPRGRTGALILLPGLPSRFSTFVISSCLYLADPVSCRCLCEN